MNTGADVGDDGGDMDGGVDGDVDGGVSRALGPLILGDWVGNGCPQCRYTWDGMGIQIGHGGDGKNGQKAQCPPAQIRHQEDVGRPKLALMVWYAVG